MPFIILGWNSGLSIAFPADVWGGGAETGNANPLEHTSFTVFCILFKMIEMSLEDSKLTCAKWERKLYFMHSLLFCQE